MKDGNWTLCLDRLDFYTGKDGCFSKEDSLTFYRDNLALVVYVDSTKCSECAIKSLHNWSDFLDYTRTRYGNDFRTYFIIAPQKSQLSKVYYALEEAVIDYPVFVDTTNLFINANPNLPENELLHTFLLNKDRRMILAGSPIDNPKIQNLMFHVLDSMLSVHK